MLPGRARQSSAQHPIEEIAHKAKTKRAPSLCGDGWPPAQTQPATETANSANKNKERIERTRFMMHLLSRVKKLAC